MRVVATICVLLATLDFFLRVYSEQSKPKSFEFNTPNAEVFQHIQPVKPEFNNLLFGEQVTVKKQTTEGKAKKKEVTFSPEVRAIYMLPEPFALVAVNRKSASQKLTINDQLLGYTLTQIDHDTLYFEKAGEIREFRIFKK